MLTVQVQSPEAFDDNKGFFREVDFALDLEHSLVSLSKWESKHQIPFLGSKGKTDEQVLDYVKFMTISPDVSPEIYEHLTQANYDEITNYINLKMTATWFAETPGSATKNRQEVITAEVIYYWLIALNIPFEVQTWHLNRLITLVKVCNEKNKPADAKKPKMNGDRAAQRRALNEARRREHKTTG